MFFGERIAIQGFSGTVHNKTLDLQNTIEVNDSLDKE